MAWKPQGRKSQVKRAESKPEWNNLYNDHRWKQASQQYRVMNPLCVECEKQGIVRAAECVDHIAPHKGNAELFWSVENWQSLCNRCHSEKTRRENIK